MERPDPRNPAKAVPPANATAESGLTDEDAAFLDRIAAWVATRGMAVPAVVFLESSKPLSFLGSQFMYFFEPMVKIFVGAEGYSRFARILEDRENIEVFLRKIEAADQKVRDERKEAREETR